MRVGITILPEDRWATAAPKWEAAEQLGFDHAWTYDHLVWGGLPDAPWFGTTPTLTAAAMVTSTIGLGTFVTSPNFRHPVTFSRDVLSLDDISGGRFLCGMGTGGDLDSTLLGDSYTLRERTDRFAEFARLLDRILREDHVTYDGKFFSANDARSLPGCVQQPRVPFLIAANGPKGMKLAAELGQGWVTYGKPDGTEEEWWASLASLGARMSETLEQAGRGDEEGFQRHLNLDPFRRSSFESVGRFEDLVGRAGELGFTDVITHWPRSSEPYEASVETMETVAAEVLPRLKVS
ncbi:LLM class flavin-dependent oxidoreductase [Flexivirga sp. ID2601S]|uniref:LLM class flavin-dependent oxidoreductase n=1 Tax=Flexivirga aerilata TaxID=1656889 RepID=A0A849AD97_9MICO|nr:LLM class flavin-dependent oxidoreductase [Flexivirga aerilata]NNG38844.1 LLM class flavin-dependent oxidoreductase [Flexivirga aerilata]